MKHRDIHVKEGQSGSRSDAPLLIAFICMLMAAAGCRSQTNADIVHTRPLPDAWPASDWEHASPASAGLDAGRLEEAVQELRRICGPDGVSGLLIIRHGYVVWEGEDTRRPLAVWSVTKSFMGLCLGLLWDDELCTPDTRAADHLAQLRDQYAAITFEHLSTFTSGYASDADPLTPTAPNFPPATAFHYSTESDLLAAALTRIARQPLYDLFMARIGSRIGIAEHELSWETIGQIDGITLNSGSGARGTGIRTNARTLARVGWLMCNDGQWNGQRLLSQRYIDYATSPRVPSDLPPFRPDAWYTQLIGCYGLNWWVNGLQADGTRLWPHAPVDTFAAQGNRNNVCFIIPSWNMVVVRLGNDPAIDMRQYDSVFKLLVPIDAAPRQHDHGASR